MRYGHVTNGTIDKGPCSLPKAWENISGLNNMSSDQLRTFGWLPWVFITVPVGSNQVLNNSTVQVENTRIVETQLFRDLTQQELDGMKQQHNDSQTQSRITAYRDESDPIFFKWQRGEATEQEWKDKVQEIKNRYPELV